MNKSLFLNPKFLLFLIIIIAAFFRLYNITQLPPGLYPDEAMNGNNALEAISTDEYKVFYPENNGREGMFMNIQALSVMAFGNEPWALRAVSSIFGILTVLGVYFLTKEILSFGAANLSKKIKTNIALLSSFLLATSFWHINFSRIGFRAIMAPFFAVWALYFLFSSLKASVRDGSAAGGKSYKLKAVLGGIFFGLGMNSYIAYRALPALIFVILLFYWWQNKSEWKKLILISCFFVLTSILMALPLGLYYLKNPADFMGRTTQVSIFSSDSPIRNLTLNVVKTAGMFNFVGDFNWRHNDAGKPELFWPVGIFFAIGIIWGIYSIFRKRRPDGPSLNENLKFGFWILFTWIAVAALPVVVSNEGIPHALRSILMIPPTFILATFGGIWLYGYFLSRYERNTKLRILLNIVACLLLVLMLLEGYKSYFIDWGKNPNVQGAFAADYVEIGRQLNALPKDMPKYIVIPIGGVLVRGIPMPSQTVMFITDTFTPEKQAGKNIHYVLPDQASQIPAGAYTVYIK